MPTRASASIISTSCSRGPRPRRSPGSKCQRCWSSPSSRTRDQGQLRLHAVRKSRIVSRISGTGPYVRSTAPERQRAGRPDGRCLREGLRLVTEGLAPGSTAFRPVSIPIRPRPIVRLPLGVRTTHERKFHCPPYGRSHHVASVVPRSPPLETNPSGPADTRRTPHRYAAPRA